MVIVVSRPRLSLHRGLQSKHIDERKQQTDRLSKRIRARIIIRGPNRLRRRHGTNSGFSG